MSRAKNRARAEGGIIFRDGKYVNKVEWHAAHPTNEQEQAEVDEYVEQLRAAGNKPYYCTKCEQRHVKGKIYNAHLKYALPVSELIAKEAS